MQTTTKNGAESHHHIIPPKTYLAVFGGLVVFTFLTVAFPPLLDALGLEVLDAPIAFLIATAKATLVLLYFMHLKYDSNMNRIIFLSTAFFLFLLVFFCLLDIKTRYILESTL